MRLLRYATAVAACLAASPALAQEAPSFTGPYVGAVIAYDHLTLTDSDVSVGKDGVAYAGVVGYDHDTGTTVYGLEAEVGDSSASIAASDLAGNQSKLSAGLDLYIGARAGFKVGPATLLYVKGGFVRSRLNAEYTDETGTYKDHANLNGFRIGAGVEHALGRFRVRGEYRYSDYGHYHYQGVDTGISEHRHQVAATVLAGF